MYINIIYSDCIVVMLMLIKEWKYFFWIYCILSIKVDKSKIIIIKLEIRIVNIINLNMILIFF